MSEKQKYIDFEAYERVAEPHKRERVSAWRTAIGLQTQPFRLSQRPNHKKKSST